MTDDERALIDKAMRENREIVILIDPGFAPAEVVAGLLAAFDRLKRCYGVGGYTITLQDTIVIDGRSIGRFVLTPENPSRPWRPWQWRPWQGRKVTVRMRD